MDLRDYIYKVNTLPRDYINHQVTFEEYRAKRKQYLILIDEELNGTKYLEHEAEVMNESIFSRALSLLKIDNV